MKLKGWVLGKVNGMGRRGARADSTPRTPSGRGAVDAGIEPREPTVRAFADQRGAIPDNIEHLGSYGALIAAIRDELEHFVASQLRLHLAIAERDRYLLTSIEVECDESDEHRELIRMFSREFKPEQIKHYLAKEVIGGLRNASSIDLSQFAGLNAAHDNGDTSEEDDAYGALLTELRGAAPRGLARPYQVTLVGRWSQLDAPIAAAGNAARELGSVRTPLAGRTLAIDIEDAGGARRIELTSVLPSRRYCVGKGEGCDVVVDGIYASRRHCEIWLERGAWWVTDAGSTNGIRVESANGVLGRSDPQAQNGARSAVIELVPGARLVLSAHAQGESRQYPRLVLRPLDSVDAGARPASGAASSPTTPVTPIVPPRRHDGALTITARMVSGVRSIDIAESALPFQVGRSRNQALVVDWAHADVSGHHFDIVALDESGASVVVHGDNGVTLEGTAHMPGARFRWKPGETLVLGRAAGQASSCTLTLSRA
ncbi:MAG TPA: FHA domain-containing protein [Casimicrobiaceae bacterium]